MARPMDTRRMPREQRNRQAFFSLINRYLPGLYRYVRHVLGYYEAVGELVPGELTAEDVVDSVVLRAYRELASVPDPRAIPRRLLNLARDYVAGEVRRLRAWHERTVSTEADIPEVPPAEEAYTLGEEILYFFEPDEDLKLEDVIPDFEAAPPDERLEAAELELCVDAALADLPHEWRRALLLRHVRGLSGEALEKALGRPAAEVEQILQHAQQYLRQRLRDAGCAVEGDRSQGAG